MVDALAVWEQSVSEKVSRGHPAETQGSSPLWGVPLHSGASPLWGVKPHSGGLLCQAALYTSMNILQVSQTHSAK